MRKILPLIASVAVTGMLVTGCANMEQKFGRGMSNSYEVFRWGELRRTVEQTAVFDSPEMAYTTGFIRGVNRSLARTGLGIYEMVTAPIPPYHPVWTSYLAPGPVYPDGYAPGLIEDSTFETDTHLGFSGGDVAPYVLGSRFEVFQSH